MDLRRLVEDTAELHCFSPGMIGAGENLDHLRVQLSRWVATGRVVRIHKGWYSLAEPYRRVRIDLDVVACTIKAGTYVSLQSALASHGAIPEHAPETTCVTTGRPGRIETPFGRISYRHIKRDAFFGYTREERGRQLAFVAAKEKALMDLLYLTPGSEDRRYLSELRLQRASDFDLESMSAMARRFRSPRLERSVELLAGLIAREETRG